MDALELLFSRNSQPLLAEPAPTDDEIELLLKAALRAPDHAWLRPWRFIRIRGESRNRLGDLFAEALTQEEGVPAEKIAKSRSKPLRAPLVMVVVAKTQDHPKVPQWEQVVSAGCAAQGILYAAHALGYGAIWRTGSMAENTHVNNGLGLAENEKIIGFLYLGTATTVGKAIPQLESADFVTDW